LAGNKSVQRELLDKYYYGSPSIETRNAITSLITKQLDDEPFTAAAVDAKNDLIRDYEAQEKLYINFIQTKSLELAEVDRLIGVLKTQLDDPDVPRLLAEANAKHQLLSSTLNQAGVDAMRITINIADIKNANRVADLHDPVAIERLQNSVPPK
jgi:hypothetical protein